MRHRVLPVNYQTPLMKSERIVTLAKVISGFFLITLTLPGLVNPNKSQKSNESLEGLARGKEHIDRLNMSKIFPLMEKQVLDELETNNLTQLNPVATVEYLRGILLHALGIINVPKRYFKKKSVVLVKSIIMDLRTDMAKMDEERENISMFYNDTQDEKEKYYRILEECKSLFGVLDLKFNQIGNHTS